MSRASDVQRLWQERVQDQRRSGSSVARYCAEHGISESSLHLWRKRLNASSAPVSMVEVIATPSAWVPVCNGVIEIVLPNSLIVRLDGEVPIARLREVIAALRDSGSSEARS